MHANAKTLFRKFVEEVTRNYRASQEADDPWRIVNIATRMGEATFNNQVVLDEILEFVEKFAPETEPVPDPIDEVMYVVYKNLGDFYHQDIKRDNLTKMYNVVSVVQPATATLASLPNSPRRTAAQRHLGRLVVRVSQENTAGLRTFFKTLEQDPAAWETY